MKEEVRRLRCKGKEEERRNEDGFRINMRFDFIINGVKGFDEGVALIDPYSNSILKEGGMSEDDGKESTNGPTRSRGTPARSCSRKGLAYLDIASFYNCWYWPSGSAASGPPSSYSWLAVVWDSSRWWTTTPWRCPTSTGRSYTPKEQGGNQGLSLLVLAIGEGGISPTIFLLLATSGGWTPPRCCGPPP